MAYWRESPHYDLVLWVRRRSVQKRLGQEPHIPVAVVQCGNQLVVDLTEVTAVDSVGEEALSFFGRLGAEFIADNDYARYICEQLNLPALQPGSRPRNRDVARPCTQRVIEG